MRSIMRKIWKITMWTVIGAVSLFCLLFTLLVVEPDIVYVLAGMDPPTAEERAEISARLAEERENERAEREARLAEEREQRREANAAARLAERERERARDQEVQARLACKRAARERATHPSTVDFPFLGHSVSYSTGTGWRHISDFTAKNSFGLELAFRFDCTTTGITVTELVIYER